MKQQKYGKSKMAVLLIVTYVFAKFQGGFASWFLFYSSLTFFFYELLAYSLMFATLQVSRDIDRNRLQDGEELVVTVRLKRRFWFPLGWNMVVEPLPDRLAGLYEPHRQLIFPWFKREVEFRYVIPALPRGYYQLKECFVSGGDFFGFIERTKTFALRNDFLVYPSAKQITHWPAGDGNFSGTVHVSHRYSDDVAAVRGVRDYHRGDRLSQIHWRASARGLGLKTKEFEHQAVNQVLFFLDVEKEHYAGEHPQLFEMAVKLTASLVTYTSRSHYHYGFVCKQQERISIPPAHSQSHFFRVFDQLARVMPEGKDSFARIIGREALEYPQGVTLAVITPSLNKKVVAQLADLAQKGRNVHLFWVHSDPTVKQEQKQALQLLAANKVVCRSIHLREYDELQRIGGA
ncbi:DUF58 domain-containing protein [Brevibacillus sp. H7]|uniref:DUF58 domain-containing protein n=1 Tax=Brevibacillus sp. H7 TaxID=3349138 RepID=UPI0037FCB0B1